MNRGVVILAVFTATTGSLVFADPPTAEVPAPTASTTEPTTPATATPAASTAESAPVAKPAASAAQESRQEALLIDQGYKPAMRNGEKVFCKREIPMGSRLPTALHCLTVAEAELIAQEGRETTERIQRTTPGCLTPATGGCGK